MKKSVAVTVLVLFCLADLGTIVLCAPTYFSIPLMKRTKAEDPDVVVTEKLRQGKIINQKPVAPPVIESSQSPEKVIATYVTDAPNTSKNAILTALIAITVSSTTKSPLKPSGLPAATTKPNNMYTF